jgi:hypothetical protein
MFTVHTEQLKAPNKGSVVESNGVRWARTTATLAFASAIYFPLWRSWTAYVSQFEYQRQETGKLKVPWMESRYRGMSEALVKTLTAHGISGWFRGVGPFLAITPIVSFMHVARSSMKRDFPYNDHPDNKYIRAGISVSSAIVAEMLCFPFRCAFILMASESHLLPQPRPSARQVLSDIFKFGLRNRSLQLSFFPSALASILSTLPDAEEHEAISVTLFSYLANLIAIRLVIASLPGAPRPYHGVWDATVTHFRSSPRTWLVGSLTFMLPFVATAFTRTSIDSYYYQAIHSWADSKRKR